MRFPLLLSACALLLSSGVGAQVAIHTGPIANSGGNANRNMVRDVQGRLYTVVITQDANGDRPLILYLSTDQGQTWNVVPFTINDASSGLTGANMTNAVNMAIDDRGVLHILWASYYYPSNFYQYYRNYDPVSGTASNILDVSAMMGATPTNRTAAMDIAVDQSNTVWIVAHAPSSWIEYLIYSTQPYAAGLTFNSVGAISPTASAQSSRIAVDTNGLIHCVYYRNVHPGIYEHRFYDPNLGYWGLETMLGNNTVPNDYYGLITSDALGNVHALYAVDVVAGSGYTWLFRYRMWDPVSQLWGSEVPLFDATYAQYNGIANYRIFNFGVNEYTGKVFAVYRDLSTSGALRLAEKDLTATTFTNLPDLTPPSVNMHEYYIPTVRGRLYPMNDNTAGEVDITWRQGSAAAPAYSLMYQRYSDCSGTVSRTGVGCADGSNTVLQVGYLGSPCIGKSMTLDSNTAGTAPYYLALGLSNQFWNSIMLPFNLSLIGTAAGCSVYCSQETVIGPFAPGFAVPLPIPSLPFLVGVSVHVQDYVLDPGIGSALPLASSDLLSLNIGS